MKTFSPSTIFIATTLLLVGCVSPPSSTGTINIDPCLPPTLSTGYPYRIERADMPKGIRKEIPTIWEPQYTTEQLKKMPHRIVSVDITSLKNFIWYTSGTDVVSYQVDKKKVEVYDLSLITPQYGSTSTILLDSNNMVWVTLSGSDGAPIARYDPDKDLFVTVNFIDEKNLPLSLKNQNLYSPSPRIYELDLGKLLLFLDQRLWLLDVKTLTAKILLDKPKDLIIYNVEIGPDKTIWAVAQFTTEKRIETGVNESSIYLVRNGNLEEVSGSIPESASVRHFPLAVDVKNNLWVSNLGWAELLKEPINNGGVQQESIFYKLIESPLFIQEGGRATYGYYRPWHIFASASGAIWYSSSPGLIRLNPENGNWCLLARGVDAKVTETSDGSIWFADEQLYKYSP